MNTSNRNQSWCYGNRSSRNNNRTIINPLFDIFGCWPFLKFINVFPELRPSGSIQFPQLPKLFNENPQLEEMSTDHCMYSVFHIMQLFPSVVKGNTHILMFFYAFRETLGSKVNCMETNSNSASFSMHSLLVDSFDLLTDKRHKILPDLQCLWFHDDSHEGDAGWLSCQLRWSQSCFLFGTFVSLGYQHFRMPT